MLKVSDLAEKMVRLDQLPKFQDQLLSMPEELVQMISGSPVDQAYFLFQHAL